MDDCSFLSKVDLELKRAERYSVFVSLVVFDMSFLEGRFGPDAAGVLQQLYASARARVREIDEVSLLDDRKMVLLLPETPRQGAEIACRRVTEVLRDELSRVTIDSPEQVIPVEMASYPDAAGAKTIADFLRDYGETHRN